MACMSFGPSSGGPWASLLFFGTPGKTKLGKKENLGHLSPFVLTLWQPGLSLAP